jgi:squalene-hopene/tetraprenyl-beta-curcumene cyclase
VPPPPRKGFAARAFLALDRVLRGYERCRPPGLRALARRRAVAWVLDRQEADGSWGGIQPPWVYSILMLRLSGMPLEAAPIQRALAGLDRFTIIDAEAGTRRLEACQSPIWDTALAIIALSDAGLAPDHPALVRAAKWLLAKEVKVRGDWAVRRPKLAPGGWAFEFANDNYPDVDDTTEVVLALRRVAINAEAAVERALAWTTGMRSKNGAWGAFDADNTRALLRKLPFCDFGEVIDPPTADVTAHAVEMFAVARMSDCPHVQRAVEWLLDQQEADGSWFGRWGANYLYGTAAVVPALVTACLPTDHPAIRRAVHWLESVQNDDGGWGEDLRSYRETDWRGHGASTASQTAWALLALLAAGEERSRAVTRGVDWLVQTQLANGSWDEPYFTGTGFPGDFYINYHLYRLVFPVMALGRYREALS